MIGTDFQKRLLAGRKERRDRQRDGWEYVDCDSPALHVLRQEHDRKIKEVAIANDGRGLWIKTATERRP